MEIIKENYSLYYNQGGMSQACWFCWLTTIVIILVPFFLSFSNGNFWIVQEQAFEQPEISYSKYYMINVNSDLQNYFSTNIGEISQIRSENKLLSPVVNAYPVYEDDEDDYPYKYMANISFYLDSSDKNNDINSIDIMLFFKTQFSGTINLAFQSYVWVNINSAVGVSQANAIGDVYFNQKTPIYAGSYTKDTYDYSPFQTENGEYFSQISDIVYNNYNRNETLGFDYKTITVPGNDSQLVEIEVEIFISKYMSFWYVPLISQVLKNAWSQYFAFFVVFYIAGRFFMRYFFRHQIFNVSIKDDLPNEGLIKNEKIKTN